MKINSQNHVDPFLECYAMQKPEILGQEKLWIGNERLLEYLAQIREQMSGPEIS